MRVHVPAVLLILTGALAGAGCGWLDDRPAPVTPAPYTAAAQAQSSPLFTPARSSMAAVVNDFFGVRRTPTQPVEFPHNIHIDKGLTCTEYCHEGVTKGPQAGLPSVNTCLLCHGAIATDKPLIQQITAMQEKGLDLAWQRVYGFSDRAHVRFNHAPHVAANVECTTCHGDVARQTVARRSVDHTMAFCVNCHRDKGARNECLTCHF